MSERIKVYAITGAARGIGRAIAERLLDDGHRVLGTYHEGADSADELERDYPGMVSMRSTDLSDLSVLDETAEFFRSEGHLDGVVLNAGLIDFALFGEVEEQAWLDVMNVNLNSSFFLIQRISSALREEATIVAISSTDAFTASYASISYTVSKAALNALMNCLAVTLGEQKVRSIALNAGWVDSGMSTEESYAAAELTPVGRNGRPEDIAAVVRFLLSSEASFISGSPLVVDGGYGLVDTIVREEYLTLKNESIE